MKDPIKELSRSFAAIYFFKFWRTSVLFVRSQELQFWTYDDVRLVFQSQVGSPCLHTLLPAYDECLTSGTTLVDLLLASMAANPLYPLTF